MDMQNVQVQTPSSKTAATTSTTSGTVTSSTSGDTGSGTFVQALIKVIEGQTSGEQAEVPTDAAASMVSAILPSTIISLITSQPTIEEMETTIQNLLNVIQSLGTEKLQSFMEQPELQQWLTKAEQLLTQEQTATLKPVQFQEILTTAAQQTELKPIPAKELVVVLNRYLELLESNPTSLIVQQLGSELKMLTSKLSESFPALTAAPSTIIEASLTSPIVQQIGSEAKMMTTKLSESSPALTAAPSTSVEANKLEGSKTDKATSTSFSNIQQSQGSSSSTHTGDTLNQQEPKGSQSQLLQRLAYISHNVKTVVVNPNVSNVVETPVISEVSTMTIDASTTQQENVTLTLTQLSDSQKLAVVTAKAEPSLHSVSAQEFAEEMTRILVKNMSITQLNGSSEAKISLVPEHLGQVDVRISVLNGQITAHFIAESAQARDLLELQLPQLRASLQQQGLQVDKLEVDQQNNLGSSLFQDQRQQQTSQQFAQNGKKNARDYDQFGADFSLEMDQAVRVNRLAYGNTFNATA
ncbi:MAG: flagellar hook-length control protein FliK [Paenibacillaceae bacterium]